MAAKLENSAFFQAGLFNYYGEPDHQASILGVNLDAIVSPALRIIRQQNIIKHWSLVMYNIFTNNIDHEHCETKNHDYLPWSSTMVNDIHTDYVYIYNSGKVYP